MTHALLPFFSITFAVTWACFIGAGFLFATGSTAVAAFARILVLLGVITPSLVALALTQRAEGPLATRALIERVFKWNVRLRWYLFAILFMPVVELSVALIHRLATGAWPTFGNTAWYLMAGAILISAWVQAGEEIGWRGYALPRLAGRFGLAGASVILGLIWAAWHLPLFFIGVGDTSGQSFPLYLLQVTALSVVFAWLYWRTGGSLLLVMLLHAAVNNTKDIVISAVPGATKVFALSTSTAAWIGVALLWLIAGLFLRQMRRDPLPEAWTQSRYDDCQPAACP